MGSSFTEYRGHGFWTRDGKLEIWLHELVCAVDRLPAPPDWLRQAREAWHLQATVGFGGCIDAGLDQWLGDQADRVVTLVGLAADALGHLREQQVLRCEALNSAGLGGQGATWTRDLAVDVVVPVAQAFLDLLARRIEWDASTPPMV